MKPNWLVTALILAACTAEHLPTSGPDRALPTSFAVDPDGHPPRVDENVFTFAVDANTQPPRSVLTSGDAWRNGNEYMLGFEFRVPRDLDHPGPGLSIARWLAGGETLYDLALDSNRGVLFLGRTCQAPGEFGQWQRVTMRVRWARDDAGYLELRCGNGPLHSAPLVFARSGFPTSWGARCLMDEFCEPGVAAPGARFRWHIGVIADEPETLPDDGVRVQIRRAVQRRLYVVFGRVEEY